jgi:hypothetical protein
MEANDMPTIKGVLSLREVAGRTSTELLALRRQGWLAPIAGGAPTTYADPVTNPLTGPTISGTTVTVDFLLQNPTRVTRLVANMVMANFFLDRIFSTGGDVQGGAVLYDQVNYLNIYTDRDIERVEPGDEFPILTGLRIAPLVAQVEKFGGKFPVTDEARRRNMMSSVNNQMMRVANTMVRKMNQRGLAEIAAAIAANSRTASSISWSASTTASFTTSTPATRPGATFAAAQKETELNEFGYHYDTAIVHPNEAQSLRMTYSDQLDSVLGDYGLTGMIVTPRKASGSVYLLAGGQVGEMRLEEPMRTVTEREGAPLLREQTWIQSAVNPVMFVTDPYAIIEETGIA